MKDYECFFNEHSEFHVFTRQSSVSDNQKIFINVQITIQWYEISRMTSFQEGTQIPATHTIQSYPPKTFDDSHPLNVFVEQPILNS